MFSLVKVQLLFVLNKLKLAVAPIFISFSSIPKSNFAAVSFSITTSNGRTVCKAPKALSKPIVPSFAKSNYNFLCSISTGLWSDDIQSIVPSITALIKAFLVASSRKGGATL